MGRRQQSKVDLLPPDVRENLHELLRDPRVTDLAATRKINAILEAEGHEERLSKSGVNRYAARMRKNGERIRQSREVAQMWIGKLGAEPQGEVGKLLNEMIRTMAFEAVSKMMEGEAPVEPKMIKDLSVAIHRLERAASENVKRDEEIRKQERERLQKETMAAVESAEEAGPMTAEKLKEKIKEVYGV